ncbi:MAG: 7-carboxy-7-deazaguanine synthase QueE [Opitutales bacterium]
MLPIHEQFYSFQGEGVHQGRAAYFIRTYGCPIHCPWCDSAGTWHPDYKAKKRQRIPIDQLVRNAQKTAAEFVVITGGEPTIHELNPLVNALHQVGLPVHLETSGAFAITADFDWITLSPKRWKHPLQESIQKADELKIIVDHVSAMAEYSKLIDHQYAGSNIWLQPEWSQIKNKQILNAITEWIKRHGAPYRAGLQSHKYYSADELDPLSAAPVPLGGTAEITGCI